jgi:hypothetical protein
VNKFSVSKLFWQSVTVSCNTILLYKCIISIMQQNYKISEVLDALIATIVFLFTWVFYFVECMVSHLLLGSVSLHVMQHQQLVFL